MNRKIIAALLAGVTLTSTFAISSPADAQWRRYGGYGYYHHGWRGPGVGPIVGGALLGLGVGALLAAPYYARPPVYYAPPPPAYYPAPYPYPVYPAYPPY